MKILIRFNKNLQHEKHEYIFLKYHWNLNISEILQGVLDVNNILELLLKYFDTFMMSTEI